MRFDSKPLRIHRGHVFVEPPSSSTIAPTPPRRRLPRRPTEAPPNQPSSVAALLVRMGRAVSWAFLLSVLAVFLLLLPWLLVVGARRVLAVLGRR